MTRKESKSPYLDNLLAFDQFGTQFNFRLSEGKDKVNTGVGFILSVFIVCVLIFYSTM